MRTSRLRSLITAFALGAGATALGVATGSSPVSAATELFSFETAPGVVRTSLPVAAVDVDAVTGLIYAVTDESGARRLVAIDPGPADSGPITPFGTVEIVGEVALPANLGVNDVDVSRDGRTVVVSATDRVLVFDRASLTEVSSRVGGAETVVASPDRADRFLVADRVRRTSIVDGSATYDLADTVDPSNGNAPVAVDPPFTWGADGDTVIGVLDGQLARIEVADPPMLIETGPDAAVTSGSMTVQGDRLLFGPALFDIQTLAPVERIDSFEGPPGQDGTSSFVVLVDRRGGRSRDADVWRRYDTAEVDAPPVEWVSPLTGSTGDWASIPDGRVAVVEVGSRSPGYLTVVDPGRIASPYGEFHAVQPARVLDTREAIGAPRGKLGAGAEITVDLAGRGGLPEDGVLAVVLNATVAAPTSASFFSIWPNGVQRPEVSNLNFGAGQSIANAVTVAVGDDGSIRLANEFGSAHAILDVVGYYSTEEGEPGARYSSAVARRLLDTRPAEGGAGQVGPGETVTVSLDGVRLPVEPSTSQVPVAVALNVTAVRPTDAGFLTVWPSESPRPVASSLNFAPGDIRANLVVVGIGEGNRSVDVYNAFGSTHVLVDVFGVYMLPDDPRLDQEGKLLPIEPFRSFDSRIDSPYDPPGRIPENRSIIFGNYFGWTDIWNVTAVNPTANGFLSVLGFDENDPNTEFPSTSNVNFSAGETVANGVYAVGAPNTEVYNPFGETHVVIDRFGYLTPRFQRPVNELWNPS